MSDDWYYQSLGFEFGPVTFRGLKDLLQAGELVPADLVREGLSGDWVSAASVRSLADGVTAFAGGASPNSHRDPAVPSVLAEFADLSELLVVSEDAAPVSRPSGRAGRGDLMTELPELAAAEDEQQWYFQTLGQVFGPVSFLELHRMVQASELSREDLLRFGETGHWVPAGTFEGLFPHVETSPPAEMADMFPPEEPAAEPAFATDAVHTPAVGGEIGRDWYCYLIGREFGPLTLAELRGLILEGRLGANDSVRWGTSGEWRLANSVEALFFTPAAAMSDTTVTAPTVVMPPLPSSNASQPAASASPDPNKISDQDRTLQWLEKHCSEPESASTAPAQATPAAAAKGAGAAKPVEASRAAASNILRNFNADVVRKPTAAATTTTAKSAPRARSSGSSGPSLGSQLSQIKPQHYGIVGGVAALALLYWFVLPLLAGMGFGTVYTGLQEIQPKVRAAHDAKSELDKETQVQLKELLAKLKKPSKSSRLSPYSSLKQAHKYLTEMAEYAAKAPPATGDDPYVRAEKNFSEQIKKAAKLLGK